jgi:hypothetical protein
VRDGSAHNQHDVAGPELAAYPVASLDGRPTGQNNRELAARRRVKWLLAHPVGLLEEGEAGDWNRCGQEQGGHALGRQGRPAIVSGDDLCVPHCPLPPKRSIAATT